MSANFHKGFSPRVGDCPPPPDSGGGPKKCVITVSSSVDSFCIGKHKQNLKFIHKPRNEILGCENE